VLKERGKRFSRLEAWLYLTNIAARGVASEGIGRGEFISSYRYLGKAWLWSVDSVWRFMKALEASKMIAKWPKTSAEREAEHHPEHFAEHFIICNYEIYNPSPNGKPNAPPNTQPNKVNKVLKKVKGQASENLKNGSPLPGETEAEMGKADEAYETYARLYLEILGGPYVRQPQDFVRLAALRKAAKIGTRDTPDKWEQTCRHYLESPQDKHTLNDFALRFGEFIKGPHDRFKVPASAPMRAEQKELSNYERLIARRSR
jgi:hypothetical protein